MPRVRQAGDIVWGVIAERVLFVLSRDLVASRKLAEALLPGSMMLVGPGDASGWRTPLP